MSKATMGRYVWLAVVLAALPGVTLAEVKLNGVFGDHMVLQRDVKIPVWGSADARETVHVSLGGHDASATAGADGKWRVELDPLQAGGPFDLVAAASSKVTLTDVLVGDVWLCSGQSNMGYPMDALKSTKYASDIESANFPQIRHGAVKREGSLEPLATQDVKWVAANPTDVRAFSAVAFYTARELQKEIKVPIGLLNSSWGGTSAEAWTSLDALSTDPDFRARADKQIDNIKKVPEQIAAFPAAMSAWESKYDRTDTTNAGESSGYAKEDLDDASWQTAQFRAKWKDLGVPDGGIVWVRKVIDVPESSAGKAFRLDWGSVEEMYETTYFNGEKLGSSGREPPQFYNRYVGYNVPGPKVKAGRNVIAIRLVAPDGDRNLLARQATGIGLKALGITQIDDAVKINVERRFSKLTPEALAERPVCPKGGIQGTSGALFNGMINPFVGLPVKGVIWYQGEQDASRGYAYRRLLPMLINDWRARWKQDLAVYVQQLPNWKAGGADQTAWAELREAQWLTAQSMKGVHVVCGLGLGESDDVHPANKRGVGERIAKSILVHSYGRSDVVDSGPVFEKMQIDVDSVRLSFKSASPLQTTDGQTAVKGFTVAGADQKFTPIDGKIEGNEVVLTTSGRNPVAVRYAFRNDPVDANLCNVNNLPAFPFRTDDWPGQTEKAK